MVKIESGDDEEDEGMNMIEIDDSWTIAVAAPDLSIVPSSSLSDVEPLFPRTTCLRGIVLKKSEEAPYVSRDNIRLNGSLKFEVYDKNELVLSGTLEMFDSNGFTGEAKKEWNMTSEAEITAESCDRDEFYYRDTLFGAIRIRSPIASVGCSRDGIAQSSESVLNMTDSPFFFGKGNSLVAVGCNSKASLTHMEPIKVACELNCSASKERSPSKTIPFFNMTGCSDTMLSYAYKPVCTKTKRKGDTSCDGRGCCQSSLPDDFEARQVIGVSLESYDNENSTKQECRVAFLTDEVYTLLNATKPQRLFAKGTNYANCGCNQGYRGNPTYLTGAKVNFNECDQINHPDIYLRRRYCGVGDTCVNLVEHHKCERDKTVPIMIDSQEIRGLADHFRAAMKENKLIDIMDARLRDACKPEQVMAVANLARRCLNSKGKKRPYMREVFTELEKICSSPEDSLVKIENDDGDDEEEEGMDMIVIADSWTVGVTAPVASPSSSDDKLFPRSTW
ncbi:hypothetical protein Bca52824_031947 [Brassica carinata]|uniref:Wall-associated receptor kinase domain-containing protein n=1 Tax=Brassica carinata TaxID=52824 RepID=A0A8X7SBI5_BRACI|nr:hypothetical protein Bca52824_031947 [Brassica carinata]